MASFDKGPVPAAYTPFGKNEFLRSTQDVKYEHYTLAKETVPSRTIDGSAQKILQPGTVLARITSGPSVGKIGPFSAAATDGRQTLANIVGINGTFLPWQLLERDVEVAVVVEGRVVQAWCIELDASGAEIPLSNTTAAALVAQKSLSILFA
jgi:hypothetical protein